MVWSTERVEGQGENRGRLEVQDTGRFMGTYNPNHKSAYSLLRGLRDPLEGSWVPISGDLCTLSKVITILTGINLYL